MKRMPTFSGRRASQSQYELTSFIELLKKRGVTRYLEIGARHGDTFHSVMSALPVGSMGVAVDLPGGLWGTAKSKNQLRVALDDLNANGFSCSAIFGNSQTEATNKLINGRGPYDAILVDGDHTLVGVSRDWQLYGGMAPIVAFHDIVGTGEIEHVCGNPVEVPLLWDRLKQTHEHIEFIAKDSTMGIGVLCAFT